MLCRCIDRQREPSGMIGPGLQSSRGSMMKRSIGISGSSARSLIASSDCEPAATSPHSPSSCTPHLSCMLLTARLSALCVDLPQQAASAPCAKTPQPAAQGADSVCIALLFGSLSPAAYLFKSADAKAPFGSDPKTRAIRRKKAAPMGGPF